MKQTWPSYAPVSLPNKATSTASGAAKSAAGKTAISNPHIGKSATMASKLAAKNR